MVRADVVATAIASDNAEVGTLGADRARVANGNSEPNGAEPALSSQGPGPAVAPDRPRAHGNRRGPVAQDEDPAPRAANLGSSWGDREHGGRFWRFAPPTRDVVIPNDLVERVAALGNNTVEHIPDKVLARVSACWAEWLEGLACGRRQWSQMARCRARLLLTWVDIRNKTKELCIRLQLWEQGRIDELLERVEQAQAADTEAKLSKRRGGRDFVGQIERQQGRRARKCTKKGRFRKAMMAFSNKGRFEATAEDRISLARALIPTSEGPAPTGEEQAAEQAWALATHGHGASDADMYKHLAVQREEGKIPTIPIPTFAALTAPGPTGERAEHLQQCLRTRHLGARRRLFRALDLLTVRAARGMLPMEARWILNTKLIFMEKGADVDDKDPDAEWLWHFHGTSEGEDRTCGPAAEFSETPTAPPGRGGALACADVLQETGGRRPLQETGDDGATAAGTQPKAKVRPIQMGELLRKVISKRILAAARGAVDAVVLGARHWGVGAEGGAEGIIHAHMALERLYFKGELPQALLVVQVDAENCFGRVEWISIREEMLKEVPELGPVIAWKHRQESHVEQAGAPPQIKKWRSRAR